MTQDAKLLKMLQKSGKNGVPNYRFAQKKILKYSSRIAELRHDGYNIVARRQVIRGKLSGVWKYYLMEDE